MPPVEFGDDEGDAHIHNIDFGMYNWGNDPNVVINRRNPELAAGIRVQQSVVRNYFLEN